MNTRLSCSLPSPGAGSGQTLSWRLSLLSGNAAAMGSCPRLSAPVSSGTLSPKPFFCYEFLCVFLSLPSSLSHLIQGLFLAFMSLGSNNHIGDRSGFAGRLGIFRAFEIDQMWHAWFLCVVGLISVSSMRSAFTRLVKLYCHQTARFLSSSLHCQQCPEFQWAML